MMRLYFFLVFLGQRGCHNWVVILERFLSLAALLPFLWSSYFLGLSFYTPTGPHFSFAHESDLVWPGLAWITRISDSVSDSGKADLHPPLFHSLKQSQQNLSFVNLPMCVIASFFHFWTLTCTVYIDKHNAGDLLGHLQSLIQSTNPTSPQPQDNQHCPNPSPFSAVRLSHNTLY
ncbi:hypothetical protein BJX76DRAFT_96447 [Aspergillus varians]